MTGRLIDAYARPFDITQTQLMLVDAHLGLVLGAPIAADLRMAA